MRISAGLLAGAVALSMTAGCGNEKSGPGPVAAMVGTMAKATVARVQGKKGGAVAAPAPVTRADLEKYGKPIMRVAVPTRGLDGYLTISDQKGDILTWSTSDGATFSQRNGVLLQTRGLGPDLMSANVPTVGQLLTAGGTHERVYYFLGDDDQGTRRTYTCTMSVVDRAPIDVMGRSHGVTHVQEECVRDTGSIKNDYWIEGASIRQSRQWASRLTGYVEFQRIID